MLFKKNAKKAVVGVDIGSTLIKVLKLSGEGAELCVEGYAVVEYESSEDLKDKIKEALTTANVNKKNEIYLGISGDDVIQEKTVQKKDFLPRHIPDAKIYKHISTNIQKLTTYQAKDVYWDYVSDDQKITVFFVRKKQVETNLNLLNSAADAGVSALVLPENMVNSLVPFFYNGIRNDLTAYFDFGSTSCQFYIFENKVMVSHSSISLGGENLLQSIMATYGVSYEDAKNIYISNGAGYDSYQEDVLKPFFQQLLQSLLGSIRVSYLANEIYDFKQVLVSGGLAKTQGIIQFFKENLTTSVSLFNPFGGFRFGAIDSDSLDEDAPFLITALANALYKNNKYLNLLPWRDEVLKVEKDTFKKKMLVAGIVGLGFSYVAYMYGDSYINSSSADNSYVQQNINDVDSKINSLKDVRLKINRIQGSIKSIQNVNQQRSYLVAVLNAIVESTPVDIYLTKIDKSKNVYTFYGKAPDPQVVSGFMRTLKSSGWFTNVFMSSYEAYKADANADSLNTQGDNFGSFIVTADFQDRNAIGSTHNVVATDEVADPPPVIIQPATTQPAVQQPVVNQQNSQQNLNPPPPPNMVQNTSIPQAKNENVNQTSRGAAPLQQNNS